MGIESPAAPWGTGEENSESSEPHDLLLDGPAKGAEHGSAKERTPSMLDKFHDDSFLSFGGPLLVLFSVYSFRFLAIPWLWHGPGLDIFVPVLSPVYRQAEHWQNAVENNAVVLHIVSGAALLLLGTMQFDKTIRCQHPTFHRWSGRAYTVCGLLCLYALRQLRSSVGAGSSPSGRSESLAVFIDVSSALWVAATLGAIVSAMSRRFQLHRDLMAFSIAMSAVPIAQRLFSWFFLAPMTVLLRLVICLYSDMPPWEAAFGPPGNSYSTIFGLCEDINREEDPRACPFVLTLDGYGEAEQSSFALSAWFGFGTVMLFGIPRLLVHVRGSDFVKPDPNSDISDLHLCDIWRILPEALQLSYSALLHSISRVVDFSVPCWDRPRLELISKVLSIIQIPIVSIIFALCIFSVLVCLTVFVTILYIGFLFVPLYVVYCLYSWMF